MPLKEFKINIKEGTRLEWRNRNFYLDSLMLLGSYQDFLNYSKTKRSFFL